MKLRFRLFMALIFVAGSPLALADENSDKLDAILKEIKSLNQRVSELEQKVRFLTAAKGVRSKQANDPLPPSIPLHEIRQLKRYPDVKGVIRLQGESPGSLLKGIHERERVLRQRRFPPEIFPQSILIIPNH